MNLLGDLGLYLYLIAVPAVVQAQDLNRLDLESKNKNKKFY
jgi:hypothetical protein